MNAMTSQITGVSIVCLTVGSGADQRKHQNSASLAFMRGIHRWPVDSPHERPVTWKMFPFDEDSMWLENEAAIYSRYFRWVLVCDVLCVGFTFKHPLNKCLYIHILSSTFLTLEAYIYVISCWLSYWVLTKCSSDGIHYNNDVYWTLFHSVYRHCFSIVSTLFTN